MQTEDLLGESDTMCMSCLEYRAQAKEPIDYQQSLSSQISVLPSYSSPYPTLLRALGGTWYGVSTHYPPGVGAMDVKMYGNPATF